MPMRTPATTSTALSRANSSKGSSSSGSALCAAVIPSASQTRPGPEQRSRSSATPRRRRMPAIPMVGSIARINTALAEPSGSHTKFTHQ
jgi:hypothetical protein